MHISKKTRNLVLLVLAAIAAFTMITEKFMVVGGIATDALMLICGIILLRSKEEKKGLFLDPLPAIWYWTKMFTGAFLVAASLGLLDCYSSTDADVVIFFCALPFILFVIVLLILLTHFP